MFLHEILEKEGKAKPKDQNFLSFIASIPSINTTVLNKVYLWLQEPLKMLLEMETQFNSIINL